MLPKGPTNADDLTAAIKAAAQEAGFARVGIASASPAPHAELLEQWLARGWHADMGYMASNLARRKRPTRLVPGARSVICLAAGYAPHPGGCHPQARRQRRLWVPVARYARGPDYHKVLKRRCCALIDRIRKLAPSFEGRAFVDSAPIMERSLAAAAGVGWIGRNGCLIAPRLGSYVLLAEIVCNLPLPPDAPLSPQCGDCRRCLAACPTGALHEDGLVDARKCISYLTVEHAGAIDRRLWPQMGTSVFGCDACQEACPHNEDLPPGDPQLVAAGLPLGGAAIAGILSWSQRDWDRATRGSAVRRAKWPRLLRNAVIGAGNLRAAAEGPGAETVRPPCFDAAAVSTALHNVRGGHPDLAELVDWALSRLKAASP